MPRPGEETRVVQPRDDAGTLAGTHLSEESLLHLLDSDTFSDAHKDTVAALNDHLEDHPGTSLRFLTAEAVGSGTEATIRATWRDEVPYGFVSTPDGSLNLRTIAAERLVPQLEHLWRTDDRARELWAASTTTVSDVWQYLRHHIQGTPIAHDLSPAKQAWLDAHLGLERTAPDSPLFAPKLNSTLADFVGDHRIDQISGIGAGGNGIQFSPRRRVYGVDRPYPKPGTKAYENFNFGRHLRRLIGDPPPGMYDPHAHHVLYKEGNGIDQKALVEEGQAILRRYGIDPVFGKEDLVWAPMRVAEQHGIDALRNIVETLKKIESSGGDRRRIEKAMKRFGNEAARRL